MPSQTALDLGSVLAELPTPNPTPDRPGPHVVEALSLSSMDGPES